MPANFTARFSAVIENVLMRNIVTDLARAIFLSTNLREIISLGTIDRKMSVNYLLHESPVGYAVFEVIHQPDTVGSRLKEVQDSIQVLRL